MPIANAGDLRISYDDAGTREPALLFMPGWCASRAGCFEAVSARLSPRHRTLALDWRGHGASSPASSDFGAPELVQDALAVIQASGAQSIIPVATAHAGWEAVELRRRLGARISKIVLVDWIVTAAPPPFVEGLTAMKDPAKALAVRDGLFAMWTQGVTHAGVLQFVRDSMGPYGAGMWARAAREILNAYERERSPLEALAALTPSVPVLHVYCQPTDAGYLAVQQDFARSHPWFQVQRLTGLSHFPTIEVPDQVSAAIEQFVSAA